LLGDLGVVRVVVSTVETRASIISSSTSEFRAPLLAGRELGSKERGFDSAGHPHVVTTCQRPMMRFRVLVHLLDHPHWSVVTVN
jgi:hypothetical protein